MLFTLNLLVSLVLLFFGAIRVDILVKGMSKRASVQPNESAPSLSPRKQSLSASILKLIFNLKCHLIKLSNSW